MFLPAKFLWSSKVPSKVKALAWLVAHGKVNTNDKLQLRRPYKALCPQWCILCKGNGESIDHLFLHCPVTIGLWHRLFNLVGVIWVPPRSIEDMLVISFKGLGNSVRDKILWQIACLTLIWMVWQERNNRIFEDKGRTEEVVWDLIRFYSSLWASCTEAFRGVPLSILQINWIGEGPLILPLRGGLEDIKDLWLDNLMDDLSKLLGNIMGLKINFKKSELIPMRGFKEIDLLYFCMPCRVGDLATKYLGIRIVLGKIFNSPFFVEESIECRQASWKKH
ncbi:hypothetical protein CK203_101816 [Vitis vinifera]|uniref:Reverse transcriptase zinc-binding domain-containing protein n=1 Tax=Vitis vinifera TaxID=29760 RepID=A0A438ESY1_VITVI|nr:hypothetical protein CK203_101816 [Vitis vinifera]